MSLSEIFIKRFPQGSVGRFIDECIVADFKNHGLSDHPKFLAMLYALISRRPEISQIERAKTHAYQLLKKTIETQLLADENSLTTEE